MPISPFLAIFAQNLALYNKNNRVLLSQALCVIGSLGNLMFKLHISPELRSLANNFRATYHTIVPSTEELYCLNGVQFKTKAPTEEEIKK